MTLYRVMKVDSDGKPLVGTKSYMLGVRPTDPNNKDRKRRFDVTAVRDTDVVSPGEGLSTSLNPGVLKVRSGEALFWIEENSLGRELQKNPDNPPHCLIEPAVPMTLESYQRALAATRDAWKRVQSKP